MLTLVNPPNPPGFVSNKDTMGGFGQLYSFGTETKIPPIDIAYVAAVLRNNGISFGVIDCLENGWELSELIIQLREQRPDIIGIRTSTPTFDWDIKVAKIIKMVTESKIIFFGPHVTIYSKETLSHPFVDAVVLGEPEFTFLEIVRLGGFSGCNGVWYKEKGEIIRNQERGLIENLDTLPFPAWDLMPYHAYDGGSELMHNLKPFVTVLTSRGCPYGCIYCPYPIAQGRKFRFRSPENVLNELEWLIKNLGIKAVLFRDPEFAFSRDRVVSICEGILDRKIHLSWRCETRMEDLDETLIDLMAKAGCIGVNLGIESADEEVLVNVKRKVIPITQAQKIIKTCKRNDIDTFCFFILGLPGDTKKSVFKTINYALKLKPAFVQFTVATPYPGTGLRVYAQDKGFIKKDSLSAITGFEPVMRNEYLTTDEIEWFQWFANEAWNMPWQKLLKRILRNFRNILSELKGWLSFEKARFKRIPCRRF